MPVWEVWGKDHLVKFTPSKINFYGLLPNLSSVPQALRKCDSAMTLCGCLVTGYYVDSCRGLHELVRENHIAVR